MEKNNLYKIILNVLKEELDKNNIPIVETYKNNHDSNISEKNNENIITSSYINNGFNIEKFTKYLKEVQIKNFNNKRTIKQMSAYEILSCLRKSYFDRNNIDDFDKEKIDQYPYSFMKSTLGKIIEVMILSLYNESKDIKFYNDIKLTWQTDKELNTLYPVSVCLDAINENEDTILDVKYTDTYDDFHIWQVKFYALVWEKVKNKKINFVEVLYVNNNINNISKKRIQITDEIRNTDFIYLINRIKYYDNCLRNNIIPEIENKNCHFCIYEKSHCKKTQNIAHIEDKKDIFTTQNNISDLKFLL